MKREAVKYNQRVGDFVVKFIDYLQNLQDNETITDALEIFGIQQALSTNEVYQIALYLKSQGYAVDPLVFHPEYEKESEVNFDEYDNALLRGEHDKAHRIYESMTPAQKQVIRDRRGCMDKKIKTAQQADTEAVIEKEVPAEGVKLVQELPKREGKELDELLEPAESILEAHNSMNLPPDSMKVFMPFAHSLDELKRVRNAEVSQEDLRGKTEDFLKNFGKVLHYIDEQDFDVAELLNLVKIYADLPPVKPATAEAFQKILALASKLQEKGLTDLSSQLMTTALRGEEEIDERETERLHNDILRGKNPGILGQAEDVVNKTPLALYEESLRNEDFDQAREIYLHMSPPQREMAEQLAKKHFAVQSIISLYKVGESLFNKGKVKEADEVSNIVKSQFVELPGDVQQEIILLIIPEDQLSQLPQGFQGSKSKGFGMEDKLMDMQKRLMPEVSQEVPCGACGCSAKTIMQLLKIADTLDQKGETEAADQVTNVLNELQKQAQMPTQNPPIPSEKTDALPQEKLSPYTSGRDIGVLKCQSCGADVLFDKKKPVKPQYCTYCAKMLTKGPWVGERVAKKKITKEACDDQIEGGLADSKPDEAFDAEELEKGTKVEMEHTNDKKLAKEIASDHLAESADYYKKLDIMEHSELKDMEKKDKKGSKIRSFTKNATEKKDDHGGKPAKVVEIADALRREHPEMDDEKAYRIAWETYCSYTNPGHEGCTEKGKSHRESPKSEYAESSSLNVKADKAKDK